MSQQNPNEKPDFGKILETNLVNMKKRTSQIKGELNDGLTDVISENFKSFFNIGQQLVAQIGQRDQKFELLSKELEVVYNAHPELKVAKEAEAKKKATKK